MLDSKGCSGWRYSRMRRRRRSLDDEEEEDMGLRRGWGAGGAG